MTTTTAPFERTRAGFTLVEVLISMALTSLVMAALLSSWGFIARSSLSIVNYTEMNSTGRAGLEVFARDVRMARDIENFSSAGMTLIMDNEDGPKRTYYQYEPATKQLIRRVGGVRAVVFEDVEEIEFARFTVLRTAATNDLETKLIQLELRMVRNVQKLETTKKIVSARYIMRNKHVST